MGFFSDFFDSGRESNQPYQPPLNIQTFMQPVSVSENQKVGILGDLVNAKQGYDNAYKQMNLWNRDLANPDLTDEQRKRISANVQGWKRERDAYAQAADSTRQTAAALGLDLSDFDGDKTPTEAAQALQNYHSAVVKNLFNTPSLRDLEENRRNELLSRGVSPRTAGIIVDRERDGMREQLQRRYKDAFLTYGKNPDGIIDDIGMSLLGDLAKVDPVQAQLLGTGYVSPSKVFDSAQQQAVALMNNDAAMARQMAQINANLLNAREGRNLSWDTVKYTTEATSRENALNREHSEKLKMMDYMFGGKGGNGKSDGKSGNKIMEEIQNVYESMVPEDADEETKKKYWAKSQEMVFNLHYKGWNKLPNDKLQSAVEAYDAVIAMRGNKKEAERAAMKALGIEEESLSKEEIELMQEANFLRNSYGDIESALRSGDRKTAIERINSLRGLLDDGTYKKLLDEDRYDNVKNRLDTYTRIASTDDVSEEDADWLLTQKYIEKYGRAPTTSEFKEYKHLAIRNGTYLKTPVRERVSTPPFEPPQSLPPNILTQPPPWQSPQNNAGTLPPGYGTGAWRP